MQNFMYPARLTPDKKDGGFVVTFPDVPEAITQGEDVDDALQQAADCLEEAIAGRIRRNEKIPEASPVGKDYYAIPLPAQTAAKAALYLTIRRAKLTKEELAECLHCDEKEVRRMLDPRYPSKLPCLEFALAVLGQQADYVLLLSETTEEERREFVLERTERRGADVVIECAGEPNALLEGLELLRRGGTYIELGSFVASGTVEVDLHRHLCAKNILLLGFSNHPFTGYERSLRLMERYREQIPFDRMITHRFHLGEAEAAMRKALERETMKVVIDPTSQGRGVRR